MEAWGQHGVSGWALSRGVGPAPSCSSHCACRVSTLWGGDMSVIHVEGLLWAEGPQVSGMQWRQVLAAA